VRNGAPGIRARQAGRADGSELEDWRSDAILLRLRRPGCFLASSRGFLEDNRLIPSPGSPARRTAAACADEHQLYSTLIPADRTATLMGVFDELATLERQREVLAKHNPIRDLPTWLSAMRPER